MWLRTGLWCVLGWCLFTQSAFAQTNEEELGRANRTAMERFSRLEVAEARAQLETAAEQARAAGMGGPALARTFANLGIVCVGGLNDNAAGLVAFKQALDLDPNVVIDPLFNAPNIEQVFTLAKGASARKAARGTTAPAPAQPPPSAGRFESTLLHAPALEQLTQTAVPVYVASAELGAVKMRISYRGLGMPSPKTAEMQRTKDGFAFLVPCSMVFEPRVDYWIDAIDAAGKRIGYAGTAEVPVVVPIVAQRTKPAPALPGQPAPAQCGTDECPPGMPGCEDIGDGSAGLGDTCRTNGDCSEGLTCQDDFCSVEGEGQASEYSGARRRPFFVEAGIGIGLAPVGKGHKADSSPPARVAAAASKLPEKDQLAYVRNKGWDCKTRPTQVGGVPGTQLYDCDAYVVNSGLTLTVPLQLVFGYRFSEKLYAAVMTRIQVLERGAGTLAGVLVGARGGYVLLDQGVPGFAADVFAGLGLGQIQPQVVNGGPYVASGLGALELGGRGRYRFTNSLAVVLTPHAFVMFPETLFNLDFSVGPEIAF